MTMKKTDKKSSFGMLSVKAGIDNDPNPTHADKIAGAKMKSKKAKSLQRVGGKTMLEMICKTAGSISTKITLIVGFDKDSIISSSNLPKSPQSPDLSLTIFNFVYEPLPSK